MGAKNKASEGSQKNGQKRQLGGAEATSTATDKIEDEVEAMTEPRQENQLPTKKEMAEIFARLDLSLKGEITILHKDLNHILRRVEETEEQLDFQAAKLKELKDQMEELEKYQRYMRYRIEDQENRNRKRNMRIRGLPDQQGEDLQEKIDKVFGHMLGKSETDKINIERIHRIRKPAEMAGEILRCDCEIP